MVYRKIPSAGQRMIVDWMIENDVPKHTGAFGRKKIEAWMEGRTKSLAFESVDVRTSDERRVGFVCHKCGNADYTSMPLRKIDEPMEFSVRAECGDSVVVEDATDLTERELTLLGEGATIMTMDPDVRQMIREWAAEHVEDAPTLGRIPGQIVSEWRMDFLGKPFKIYNLVNVPGSDRRMLSYVCPRCVEFHVHEEEGRIGSSVPGLLNITTDCGMKVMLDERRDDDGNDFSATVS